MKNVEDQLLLLIEKKFKRIQNFWDAPYDYFYCILLW